MPATDADKKLYFDIWAKVVDTQMHFNEMSVKSRQFGLAFVAAALGLAIVLLSRGEEFSIFVPICGGFNLHATVLVVLASALALYAVRILDVNVYHKMLRGAVTFGEDFERNYMKEIFDLEKGMTLAISHYSRYEDANVKKDKPKYHYTGTVQRNALMKIIGFYNWTIGALLVSAAVLFLMTAHFGGAVSQSSVPQISSGGAHK